MRSFASDNNSGVHPLVMDRRSRSENKGNLYAQLCPLVCI